ncbi:hypothetical protein F3C99_11205 [Vitellibacter sp. q18]|nr:hypothetical protein [Aequorivita lutea]
MSLFTLLQNQNRIPERKNFSFWKINLSENEVKILTKTLQFGSFMQIDPRDVALYYSIWWKHYYNGGKPSKKEIFESLGGNIIYTLSEDSFYKLAKQGAQMMGVKWLKRQNTLYFRTLLLQGGLPLKHITENQSTYQSFLMAVLEEQPETLEDFIFNPEITNILPKSSQNEIIYENCFAIVKSIIDDERIYDDLIKSSEVLNSITAQLQIRKQSLVRKERLSKPQNYWILNFEREKPSVVLRIGLSSSYDVPSLTNILGFEATGREYQFYLNERLICVFYKMLNGKYKTEWYQQQDQHWDGDSNLPYAYFIENGKKIEIKDFIQTVPNLYEPSLWVKYSDTEWRLIKGSGTSEREAAVLFPNPWKADLPSSKIEVYGHKLSWITFEGEIEIFSNEEVRKYRSATNSFEWTIESQKPKWMAKSSVPVVRKIPKVIVYDQNNKVVSYNLYDVWVKPRQDYEGWQDLSKLRSLPLGYLDLKIEKDGLLAYDTFFNIGNLEIDYHHKSIDKAELKLKNNSSFEYRLEESPILDILMQDQKYELRVKTEFSKIPTGIKGSVGIKGRKKLYFEMLSPFEGMAIIDGQGQIINPQQTLSLKNLYGLRILSTPNKEMTICLKNKLKGSVKIIKDVSATTYPLIAFKEDILRLYYLQDAMDYRNKVILELRDGREVRTYEIGLFSHTIDVTDQKENRINLYNSDDQLELFAVPLNCTAAQIEMIPVVSENSSYNIPHSECTSQFVVISPLQNGDQVMPRFVNTDSEYIADNKETRIQHYHCLLSKESLKQDSWQILLKYFIICADNEIPFSTFDQITAISQSSKAAARAFFFLGINQSDSDEFIQKIIPRIERDLGFCFHWIKKNDWSDTLDEMSEIYGMNYYNSFFGLLNNYLRENELFEISGIFSSSLKNTGFVTNAALQEVRQLLGEKVLNELPSESPFIESNYKFPIDRHPQIRLLLQAPIAVAESIADIQHQFPIWGGNEKREIIRRNIQYVQYLDRQHLNSSFYNKIICQTLTSNSSK